VLLAAMADVGVDRLVVASSMVVYGEGRYACEEHGAQVPGPRSVDALDAGDFENHCATCGRPLAWETVEEDARLDPRSSYAASKVATEHYVAAWARQAPGAAVALRYHNVYGPRMPRDTPYSGVAALFRSALEQGQSPDVFEDGGQVRDFVHVSDVGRANVLSLGQVLDAPAGSVTTYNVCSGRPIAIRRVAELVARGTGRDDVAPRVSGRYRLGDVRHIVASPDRARERLGFEAQVGPEEGLREFATAPLR
jgi:dTDP-L-rhamnose 4-epimerase